MADRGKRDKGKREHQKKAQLTQKEKRKKKKAPEKVSGRFSRPPERLWAGRGARFSEPGGVIAFCSGWATLIPVAARAYHRQLAGVAS